MKVAVIPARGGSKRIPRKNLREFAGRPMIAWSIRAAIGSGCFDRVVVSTDDPEIAETARAFGADVPFMRPPALSGDTTPTVPVIAHALERLAADGAAPVYACCLYATAPFVQEDDLRRGASMIEHEGCDYVATVTRYVYPIQRALRVNAAGRIEMLDPSLVATRSQDLEPALHDAGQFYWGRASAWLGQHPILSTGTLPLELPHWRVQDIDTPDDWARAERMFAALDHKERS